MIKEDQSQNVGEYANATIPFRAIPRDAAPVTCRARAARRLCTANKTNTWDMMQLEGKPEISILYGDHEQTKNHDVIAKHDPAITRAWRVSPDQGRPRRWKAMQVDCVQFLTLSRPWAFPPRVTRRSVTRHRACTGRGLCSKKKRN
jgi:hypothetical protein